MADGIWILTHQRVGDLQQMRRLASLLAVPAVEKRLCFRNDALAAIPELAVRLLDRKRSDFLEPPWPRAIFCAEARAGSIARQIKRQSAGRVPIVCIGRPSGDIADFDLVISTAQFRLPDKPNVLLLPCPLLPPRATSRPSCPTLPRASRGCPRRASPFWSAAPAAPTYSTKRRPPKSGAGCRPKRAVSAARSSFRRSLRTGPRVDQALAAAIDVPAEVFLWSKQKGPNPYRSFLAAADRFIVTSDSVSMAWRCWQPASP